MDMLTGYRASVSVTMSAEMNTFLEKQKLGKTFKSNRSLNRILNVETISTHTWHPLEMRAREFLLGETLQKGRMCMIKLVLLQVVRSQYLTKVHALGHSNSSAV